MDKLMYGVPEVCAITDLGRTKVCELIASGDIPSVKVGKRRLVPAPGLAQFVSRLVADQEERAGAPHEASS